MGSVNLEALPRKPLASRGRFGGTSRSRSMSNSSMPTFAEPTSPLAPEGGALAGELASGPVGEPWLLRRLRRRDPQAFQEMVLRHQVPVYSLCFRMLGNAAEAEDVAQDVFVRCFLSIERFRGDSSLSTWLYRIAINLCKNRIKHLSRRRWGFFDRFEDVPEGALNESSGVGNSVGEPAPAPDAALTGSQTEALVQRALARLDPEHRELLVLRDIEGLSYSDVQAITGLAEGTVKSRLHRARLALKEAYEQLTRATSAGDPGR